MGDETSANGVVVEGLATNTWQGKANAYEGDKIKCASCKSTGVIQCAGTRISHTGSHGREAALDGDLCICRCTPAPRLIASQSVFFTEGTAPASPIDFGNGEKNIVHERAACVYDQHLVFEDQDGAALEGIPYHLSDSRGLLISGITCAGGKTKVIPGDSGDTLSCLIAGENPA